MLMRVPGRRLVMLVIVSAQGLEAAVTAAEEKVEPRVDIIISSAERKLW